MDDPFLSTLNHSTGENISSTTGLPFTISSPKCVQLYNIFHPSDPIAYRLEPLIAPAMSSLKPQVLPYTKKGIFGGSASQGLTGIGARVGQSVSGFWSSLSSGIASSLLNRSLGLSGEDVASMAGSQPSATRISQASIGAGTNITSGGVVTDTSLAAQEISNGKKRQHAEHIAADREGSEVNASILITDEIETLYSGFQKTRGRQSITENHMTKGERTEAEEKGRMLRREELKVRGLNKNGRVDFSVQEYAILPTYQGHTLTHHNI
jgi:DDHD domain